jgi:hypothetical protein
MPSTELSLFASISASSRSSRSTSRKSKAKPLCSRQDTDTSHCHFNWQCHGNNYAHFSVHVLPVHSAYTLAAGSELERKPTRSGLRSILLRPSLTSSRTLLAMLFARMTLQLGLSSAMAGVSLQFRDAGGRTRRLTGEKGEGNTKLYTMQSLQVTPVSIKRAIDRFTRLPSFPNFFSVTAPPSRYRPISCPTNL